MPIASLSSDPCRTQADLSKDVLTVKLSSDLLQRLRIGDRPSKRRANHAAVLEVARLIGLTDADTWNKVGTSRSNDVWNKTIGWLDEHYPDWRGYRVTVREVAVA